MAILVGAALGAGLTCGLMFVATETVQKFAEEKTLDWGSRGCLIEEPLLRKDLSVVFYGQDGRITLDLTQLSLDRTVSHRWLGGSRALYLDLMITYYDSYPVTSQVEMVYDFEGGQLFVVSDLTLWRSWNPNSANIAKHWTNAREFADVVQRLDSDPPRAE